LSNLGLLIPLDADPSLLIIDPLAAANLDEAGVVTLHHSGALTLLHAGLISLSHLAWMAKAERHLTKAPTSRPTPASNHQRMVPGSHFLAALAADACTDEALIQLPELTR
jgi:hypothetical protein